MADSNPWAVRCKKTKQPKFKDKDLKRVAEFDIVLGLEPYSASWSEKYSSAYIADKDDASSISSCSTNATMDNIPGTGRELDMRLYQSIGRAVEKFSLKIAIRLNICHPSPAQIFRFLGMLPAVKLQYGEVEKPSDVIARISAERPPAVPGILSLVQQSQ